MLQELQGRPEPGAEVDWSVVVVDSTVVRAHQHAAGACREPAPKKRGPAGAVTDPEALGRSRGGLTTKLHVAAEGRGRLLALHLSAGQRNDCRELEPVLDGIRVPGPRGRPRKRPDRLSLDRGYRYRCCRQTLRRRKIPHVIPERRDQRERRQQQGRRGGRPPRFDRELYARRNIVERCINRLKQFRAVATRYDKRAVSYLAVATIAAIILWIRH